VAQLLRSYHGAEITSRAFSNFKIEWGTLELGTSAFLYYKFVFLNHNFLFLSLLFLPPQLFLTKNYVLDRSFLRWNDGATHQSRLFHIFYSNFPLVAARFNVTGKELIYLNK
jgi:hypothetical protein